MKRSHRLLVAGIAALAWLGCADEPAGPDPLPPDSPGLILSDPVVPGGARATASLAGSGVASVAFVALRPGTVPGAEFVIIRNLTAGDAEGVVFPVVDGGFDPVVILAEVGDRLELEFHDHVGNVLERRYGRVPRSQPPSIVRVSPPKGRTDVALAVRPTVVFSEPVDPASLDGSVRLLRGGNPEAGQVIVPAPSPWAVEFVPDAPLEPVTAYEIQITTNIRDLDGEALPAAARTDFTTESNESPPPPPPPPPTPSGRIAFVSTRSGSPWIHLANADGSGVAPLAEGIQPAWSRDGRMIAFIRGDELRVIGADGDGERLIVSPAANPAWSPDGDRLAYRVRGQHPVPSEIRTIRVDGTGDELLLTAETLESDPEAYESICRSVDHPAWSPDARSIAFDVVCYYHYLNGTQPEAYVNEIWLVKADGSDLRKLEGMRPRPTGWGVIEGSGYRPAWSPDGSVIAFQRQRFSDGLWHSVVASRALAATAIAEAVVWPESDGDGVVERLDWSPEGGFLAFVRRLVTEPGTMRISVVPKWGLAPATPLLPEVPGVTYDDYDIAWSRISP